MVPRVARLTLPHGPAAPQTQHSCIAQLTLNALPRPHCSPVLPTGTAQTKPHLAAALTTSPDELSSQCSYSAGSLPYPLPNPTLGAKSECACWGTLRTWVGLLPRPQCSLGQAPRDAQVASEAGPGWWGVCGSCLWGRAGSPWPQDPTSETAASAVTSQLRGSPPPATPGPPVPRPCVLVTGLWCRLRVLARSEGGRDKLSEALSDVDSARPLPADRADLGVRRLLRALRGL